MKGLIRSLACEIEMIGEAGTSYPFADIHIYPFYTKLTRFSICSLETVRFETYYRKATNYVVVVALASFIQIIILIRQMEYTNTQTVSTNIFYVYLSTLLPKSSFNPISLILYSNLSTVYLISL